MGRALTDLQNQVNRAIEPPVKNTYSPGFFSNVSYDSKEKKPTDFSLPAVSARAADEVSVLSVGR